LFKAGSQCRRPGLRERSGQVTTTVSFADDPAGKGNDAIFE